MNSLPARKRKFCIRLLTDVRHPIGFADVGSGGKLKIPWSLIPEDRIHKYDFEPTSGGAAHLPLCVSNRTGQGKFYVAGEERASSLHEGSREFAERFGQEGIYAKKTIDVQLTTLDEHFQKNLKEVEVVDINVEGHDCQALEGATELFTSGHVLLLKIEFELTEVWYGQKWFADIDARLRSMGYELANIDVAYLRPVKVLDIPLQGEPVWGKAFYVPSLSRWRSRLSSVVSKDDAREILRKAVVLYTLNDFPGRAFDLLDLADREFPACALDSTTIKEQIRDVFARVRMEKALNGLFHVLLMPVRILNRIFRKLLGK